MDDPAAAGYRKRVFMQEVLPIFYTIGEGRSTTTSSGTLQHLVLPLVAMANIFFPQSVSINTPRVLQQKAS